MKNSKDLVYKTALAAVLCAQAIALGWLESLLPAVPWLPPGAKPGLANIIIMFAAGNLGLGWTAVLALVKAGFAFVTRGVTAGLMSLCGGLLSAAAMYFLLKYAGKRLGLIGISVISSLCHNAGQLAAAAFLTGTADIIYYAPALAVFGVATGAVTGMIFKAVIPALEKQKNHFLKKKEE